MNAEPFLRLLEIMKTLRSENGCPWDREQTHQSLRPYCLEEAYEVVATLDEGNLEKLKDELGDLLLQIVFHAQLAEESKTFSIQDVIQSLNEKLIRRHPHVFKKENEPSLSAKEVLENWSKIKKQKEGKKHLLEGIPKVFPALLRATRVGEKAATVHFDWGTKEEVWKKVEEEIQEVQEALSDPKKVEQEFGDLLFSLSQFARHLQVDPESSLRMAVEKFEKRFFWMEEKIKEENREASQLTPEEWDRYWNQSKEIIS